MFLLPMIIFILCSYPFLLLFYFVGDGSAESLEKGTLDGGGVVLSVRRHLGCVPRCLSRGILQQHLYKSMGEANYLCGRGIG